MRGDGRPNANRLQPTNPGKQEPVCREPESVRCWPPGPSGLVQTIHYFSPQAGEASFCGLSEPSGPGGTEEVPLGGARVEETLTPLGV